MKKYIIITLATLVIAGCQNSNTEDPVTADITNKTMVSEEVSLEDNAEFDLSASRVTNTLNGKTVSMMAYNSSIPGPTFKVKQGSEIIVNFKNDLDQPTALHSHGLRLDNEFDGVPGVTQDAIEPGESFTYKLKFPDSGIYFYHPHVREDVQQDLGLYGSFIVEPTDGSKVTDKVIFLDDIEVRPNGDIDVSEDKVRRTLMGRFGNTMLTNGQTDFKYDIKQGVPTRLTFANVANVRPFKVVIEGAKVTMIGSDAGNFESPFEVDEFIIAPSERYTVDVLFSEIGSYRIQNKTPDTEYTLGKINVTESEEEIIVDADESIFNREDVPNLESYFTKAPDKELTLSMEMDMGGMGSNNMMAMDSMPCHAMPDGTMMGDCGDSMSEEHESNENSDGIEWEDEMEMMNAMSNLDNVQWKLIDSQEDKEGNDIDWEFNQGELVKLRLFNDPNSDHPMQHPFHIHGQRFVVLNSNGVENTNLAWKDTVLVPSGDTLDILVEITNPGTWVAHCHIPEHMEAGMMFSFKVN